MTAEAKKARRGKALPIPWDLVPWWLIILAIVLLQIQQEHDELAPALIRPREY